MIAKIEEMVQLSLASVQAVQLSILEQKNISMEVLRLDRIHPLISGNKWFKLKYSLQQALLQSKESIVTFGGAYSNHVLATACACKEAGMRSIGIIRGEKPKDLSCTLMAALDQGMLIEFVPRPIFANKEQLYEFAKKEFKESFLVEEGGRNEYGILGAEEILKLGQPGKYQYICCSIGSGTMMAGIIRASDPKQLVVGFSSLKTIELQNELAAFIVNNNHSIKNYEIIDDYHFGGYAKYDKGLLQFMNELFTNCSIPTDFVYTGKLFYGIIQLLMKGYFEPGKAILVIHSGGLQGNCSLPPGTLLY
jgi:1-aminocyclopropane-1-carboxylate deaminase/D-cysteine desulfhydrase-like pyridoxal-dependent ACC family enzyme